MASCNCKPGHVAVPAALLLLALLQLCSSAIAGTFVDAPLQARMEDGDYLVVFEDGVQDVAARAKGLAKKYSVDITTGSDFKIIKGFAYRATKGGSLSPRAMAMQLAKEAGVARVEAVPLLSLNPTWESLLASGKGGRKLHTLATERIPTGVARIEAAMPSPPPAFGTAAVLDTGVDLKHPDLNIHPSGGMDFADLDEGVQDGNGHGTHVSGIIAAKDNGQGVVGVAPGATILPIKVLSNSGTGSGTGLLRGLDWVMSVARNPAYNISVVSISVGFGSAWPTIDDAINKLVASGVPVVVAAGNSNVDLTTVSPARASLALTVTAINDTDGLPSSSPDTPASFSNWCPSRSNACKAHTIAAPGVGILSTWPMTLQSNVGWPGYVSISGTSMATPHISGLVLRCMRGPCAGLKGWAVSKKVMDLAKTVPSRKGYRNPSKTTFYGSLPIAAGFFDPK